MVSRNNQQWKRQQEAQRVPHYGLRKLSVGVASVLLSTTLYMGVTAHADTMVGTSQQPTAVQPTSTGGGTSTSNTTTDVQSTTGQPTSNGANTSIGNATTDAQPMADQSASKVTNSTVLENDVSAKVVPIFLPEPSTSERYVQLTAETDEVQPATNSVVESDNNDLASDHPAVQPSATEPTEQSTDPVALMTNFAVTEQSADNTHNPATTTLTSKPKWAIRYTDEAGKKLLPDSVIAHDYTRTDTGDQMGNWVYVPDSVKVTGTPNVGSNIDNPTFKFDQAAGKTTFDFATWQATAASIDGYTPDHNSVVITDQLPKDPGSLHATETVDSGTHEFTFVYTKQPTKVTINYVDDEQGEKVVGTGTVSGKTGTEVTITPQLPNGYMLTPDKDVPSKYTVTDDNNQAVTIHVQKQFIDVSDTDPQAKQTRTITLHYVYGDGDKQGQPAFDDAVLDVYYHRTATLNRATNQTTYGDWMWDQSQGDPSTSGYHVVSGKWTNLPQSWATVTADVPNIKGYSVDLGQNDPANTNHVPANTWVFPTYNNAGGGGHTVDGHSATAYLDGYGYEVSPTHTIKYVPNKTTVTVNYVDDDNNKANVGSQHWDGTIGQHIDLTLTPPTNYVLSPGWANPTSYDFDGVNSMWYTVHVKHATQDVTATQPEDQVNKTETLTRKHLYGPGPHEGENFGDPDIIEVPWHRTAMKDLVTGKVNFGDWHVVWDKVKQLSGATKMWGDSGHNWVNGGLICGHNYYSYLGLGAKTEAIATDGTVSSHSYYWDSESDIEKYPTIVQYYGREKVNVLVDYVDFDTNQWLGNKRLTGDNYLDGNAITFNKGDLTDWGTRINKKYQLYAGQTLPTSYKIDTFAGVKAIKVQVVKDRSVKVAFVDDDAGGDIVGTPTTITGHTGGDPVALDLTVPDKYQLADGQQLPTSYTFTKGSGDVTIHLKHQVVQREATTNVYMFEIPNIKISQQSLEWILPKDQWNLVGEDEYGRPENMNALRKKLGTISGHVNYDLVTNRVTSVVDDWTSLNLQDQTFSVPTTDAVVNGVMTGDDGITGKTISEYMKEKRWGGFFADDLKYPLKAYLSQQLTATEGGPAFYRVIVPELVPGGSNRFANERGDTTGSAFKLTEPINRSYLEKYQRSFDWKNGDSNDFRDQNGQLVSDSLLRVSYIYVPYIEKTVTRTINVVKPDGTKQQVVQTATLDKAVSLFTSDKLNWSTSEWASYEVPTIPGYTASQSNVAKETVTDTTEGQTVNITYTANEHQISVEYVDNATGQVVKTDHVSGKTGQTVSITPHVPDGWELVSGQSVSSEVTLGADGAPITVIKVQPQERSIAVKFVDDQSGERQVGQDTTLTGRDGDTVDLKLTVPDKYRLADGQQLPTSYTFTKGSGDLKIHLVHQIVQREATIDVQRSLATEVLYGSESGDVEFTVTQTQWKQLDDKTKHNADKGFELMPLVEVGTLTGHVGYDLVNKKVVSFGDDWTSLNLGDHNYKFPNGNDVVNGISLDFHDPSYVERFKDQLLNYYWGSSLLDPDYVNRPWHGYLSANAINNTFTIDVIHRYGLQAGLVGNEPNALAKATGDRAATAVETTNKTIDLNWLKDFDSDFDLDFDSIPNPFVEQNGQLRAKVFLPVYGVYIPYVEKTVTRTINVTMPDGKTTTVKQTATLAKQVDFSNGAHSTWTTDEWASYEVPTIPGYTASQSNVAKETVTDTTKDQIVNITYTANDQQMTITFYDQDGKKVTDKVIKGTTGLTIPVGDLIPDGWELYDGQNVPKDITFKAHNDNQDFVIKHVLSLVSADNIPVAGSVIKGTKAKTYPEGLTRDMLTKTITRTIRVMKDGHQIGTKTQRVTFLRNAVVDAVTGSVKTLAWSEDGSHVFTAYQPASIEGYTVDVVKAMTVSPLNEPSTTVIVNYKAVPQALNVIYQTADGQQVGSTASMVADKDGQIDLTSQLPNGYELATPVQKTNVSDLHVNNYYVTVKPQLKIYTSEDADIPSGVYLTKVVNRTINITLPNGKHKTINQTVNFNRMVTIDANGNSTYTDWKAVGTDTFDGVRLPVRRGYKLVFDDGSNGIKSQRITNVGTASDVVINVSYVKA